MGIYLDPRYPITGVDTNVSTAGIHAQTARKSKDTYHYMGERYGNPVRILFGTTSGGDTARSFLEINGYEFSDEQLTEYTNFMKRKANELKHYLTETEMAIFAEQIINGRNRNGFRIDDYRIESVMSSHDASVIFYTDGHMWGCSGVGAVDSAFNGLRQRFGYEEAKLTAFKPVIKGIGQKAQMQVMSVIDYQGKSYWGRGVSEDVAKAPVDSVIDAFHNMHFLLNKQ
jgi:2-isopropylmalate synthase